MSQVLIFFIRLYQMFVNPLLATALGPRFGCRYEITCSEYAIRSLRDYGAIRGSVAGIRRVLICT